MKLNGYLFNMKTNEFNDLVNSLINEEVKNKIIESMEEGEKEVYHIKCEGEPIDTFSTKEEAESHLDIYKKNHPGKQFIIEKGVYESDTDMIDKLDKMGEQLEEKEQINMKKEPIKVKSLAEAVLHAKENGLKKIKVEGEHHDVDEMWKSLEEEESQCDECGEMSEDNDIDESNAFVLAADAARDDGKKEFEFPKGSGKMHKVTLSKNIEVDEEISMDDESDEKTKIGKPSLLGRIKNKIKDKLTLSKDEEGESKFREFLSKNPDLDFKSTMGFELAEDDMEPKMCSECGTGQLNEEGVCNECGYMMNESKKLRLTESQLVDLIGKMVVEASMSGVPLATRKAQEGSKRDNLQNTKEVEKKMKDYLNFDGNDNPEFPNQVGGEKMAHRNTTEEEEFIANNRGGGLQNLDYDTEPSDRFKERLKMAIEGNTLMGNAPTSEKPKIKPSNGADKGKESKHKSANVIKTKTADKIEKQMKGRLKDKKERTLYPKEKVPTKSVNESDVKLTNVLKEEIERMNKISSYNKNTQ
jgi:hypothetical protein